MSTAQASVGLGHLAFALGEHQDSVSGSAGRGLFRSPEDRLHAAGFRNHHTCGPSTSAYDLARNCVLQIRDGLEDIDAIVYSTCIPANANLGAAQDYERSRDVKHLMDFPASHLQADFGLEGAFTLGITQQACTGMLGSIRVARMILSAEPQTRRVLCVTADRFPEGALYEQSYNVISDGAAACIVTRQPSAFRILACHAITNGALAQASDDETVGSFFNQAHRAIEECLQRAGMTIDDLTWIVPQNTNVRAWQILAKLLGFDFEHVYFPTLPQVGHVISGDNIVNLAHLQNAGRLEGGDKVLLFMAGYGLNWQVVVLEREE